MVVPKEELGFKVGDVVCVKSQPDFPMTLAMLKVDRNNNEAYCEYMFEGSKQWATFYPVSLMLYNGNVKKT